MHPGVLLDAGAEVNVAASDGTTALVVATIRGHTALVRYLLNRDADANAGPGFAPLHWAVGEWNTGLTSGRRDEGSEWSVFKGLKGEAKLGTRPVAPRLRREPETSEPRQVHGMRAGVRVPAVRCPAPRPF